MYQAVRQGTEIIVVDKASYLEGKLERIQVSTQVKYKIAHVLRPWRHEIRGHESTSVGLESRC